MIEIPRAGSLFLEDLVMKIIEQMVSLSFFFKKSVCKLFVK